MCKLAYALANDFQVIFVDETSVKINCRPQYGWGKKGKKLCAKVQNCRQSYTIATAITDRKIIGCQILLGGVKGIDYLGFLCTTIKECLRPGILKELIIFADNAPSHVSTLVREKIGNQVIFLMNAPYSPMLNPIEEFFSKMKYLLRKSLISEERQLIYCS